MAQVGRACVNVAQELDNDMYCQSEISKSRHANLELAIAPKHTSIINLG
jgi:hypothetical protein